MDHEPSAERHIDVKDLLPGKAKEDIRASLINLGQLIVFTISALQNGIGVERGDRLKDLSYTIETILIMMDGVNTSIKSIFILTRNIDPCIRDCYGITRSVCEGSINIAYILTSGNEIASRARRHGMQKSYRDLSRIENISGFKINYPDLPPLHDIPGMQKAIDEFTRRNGTEITEWSGLNLTSKVDAIVAKYPGLKLSLQGSISGLYRTSSELLHGTFAGAELFWTAGNSSSPISSEFEIAWAQYHLVSIFTSVWASVLPMLEVVDEEFNIPVLRHRKREWLRNAMSIFDITVEKPA